MDSQEIATAILSLTLPGIVGWNGSERLEIARRVSHYTADLVVKRPDRFLCVAVPDGATELERLRDRNQGIAPPSNADRTAIIRAKDELICQLKTAALETDRLRDRVEQLEQLVGVDRSLTSRLRTAFGLEPGVAQVMGMLLKRDFVTHDALYVVLYSARWRRRHRR